MRSAVLFAVAVNLCMSGTATAQRFEREARPAGEARPQRYLSAGDVDFATLLAPPPPVGSAQDDADGRLVIMLQDAPEARFASARADAALVYPRFEDAFGGPIDRATSPALIGLLNRGMRDVAAVTFAAKEHFSRPRPFQRLQLSRVCGRDRAPTREANPTGGSSYPSGHTAYGWATAMILARVRPDRAPALMARAAEYAESRIVCGVHFPSDIAGGQVVAAAVVARLDSDPSFRADLARARAEVSALSASSNQQRERGPAATLEPDRESHLED